MRARAAAVANYLPNAIAGTRDWLDRAVLAGEVSRGRFELKGDLGHFPFRDASQGRFFVEARSRTDACGITRRGPRWTA